MPDGNNLKFETSGGVAGRISEAIHHRWQELATCIYSSAHRAVADLTRDAEKILGEAGLEAVPPFPGSLDLGAGLGSSSSETRRYRCAALKQVSGRQVFTLDLEVSLAPDGRGRGSMLERMIPLCPSVRIVSPR